MCLAVHVCSLSWERQAVPCFSINRILMLRHVNLLWDLFFQVTEEGQTSLNDAGYFRTPHSNRAVFPEVHDMVFGGEASV